MMIKTQVLISFLLTILLTACTSETATKPPELLWNLTESVQTPESAYYDGENQIIYISNVAGSPTAKDTTGWISKLDATGKPITAKWATGLNAPKGIGVHAGTLWVADIDHIVAIDTATGKTKQRIRVKGAKFLNDIAIGEQGEVYISDTLGGRIYQVKDGKTQVFAQGDHLESPNGLLVRGGKLYVAGWGMNPAPDFTTKVAGHLYTLDLATKQKTLITGDPLGNLDGLQIDKDGNFLVTDWMAGKVYRVSPDGNAQVLLEGFKGAADLGYNPASHTLILPRMGEDRVSTYQLAD